MKKRHWVIGDLHLGQTNCFNWLDKEGNITRPFKDYNHYLEVLINNWNSIVEPQDKVYILGDLAMNRNSIKDVLQLNGHKTLIAGNHDIFDAKDYMKYGINVRGVRVFTKGSFFTDSRAIILSHIPLARECLLSKWFNIHAHTHDRKMSDDNLYYCCSVEQTNFFPIDLEALVASI